MCACMYVQKNTHECIQSSEWRSPFDIYFPRRPYSDKRRDISKSENPQRFLTTMCHKSTMRMCAYGADPCEPFSLSKCSSHSVKHSFRFSQLLSRRLSLMNSLNLLEYHFSNGTFGKNSIFFPETFQNLTRQIYSSSEALP